MAGHSQFKNIMHRKGAQDKRRAREYTKIGRELQVAARLGSADADANPRLRAAIAVARKANMPKDNVERAIRRGSGTDPDSELFEMRYEGYGPGGVALIVEALTDNRNRTASEVRALFNKFGGNLGETGSVGFMFDHVGEISFAAAVADEEAMFDAALEAGAEEVAMADGNHVITTALNDFTAVRDALEERFGEPEAAGLIWRPQMSNPIDEKSAATLLKLIDGLEDSDDVQLVFANFEIADDVMARLTA